MSEGVPSLSPHEGAWVRRASLSRQDFTSIAALADGIAACPLLTSIDLSGCNLCGANMPGLFDATGFTALAAMIGASERLVSINLAKNNLAGLRREKTDGNLAKLRGRYNGSAMRALCSALRQSTSLTEANLSNNHFGKKGAKSLHLGIKFGRLTLLDISGNEIGKKGSKSLARAIKVNSTLHRVGLSCSDLISPVSTHCNSTGLCRL